MKSADLLQLLPRDVRGIGEEVINAMTCSQQILSWNEKLELYKDYKTVPGTNIVQLLEYILYPQDKDALPPTGFDEFLDGLKKIELESQWVRNADVIKELDNNEDGWDSDKGRSSDSDSEQSNNSDNE